jgi:hypothetical protein
MRNQSIIAVLALALSGSACAQIPLPPAATTTAPVPPTAMAAPPPAALPVAVPPNPLASALPPLPPGCVTAAPPAPQPPAMAVTDIALKTALGLSQSQAAQVRQVFERRALQQQRLEQERRDLDATTCRKLRDIVGDQGLARWWSMIPSPPIGPHGPTPPPPPLGMTPPPAGP